MIGHLLIAKDVASREGFHCTTNTWECNLQVNLKILFRLGLKTSKLGIKFPGIEKLVAQTDADIHIYLEEWVFKGIYTV